MAYTPLAGGRFFNEVRTQYTVASKRGAPSYLNFVSGLPMSNLESSRQTYGMFARAFDDPETRRAIIDVRQAAEFAEAGTLPRIEGWLRLPFQQMWIEPTEALKLPEDLLEPGVGADDELIGMLVGGRANPISAKFIEGGEEREFNGLINWVTCFFYNPITNQYIDCTFMLELSTGFGVTRFGQMIEGDDPSIWGDKTANHPRDAFQIARPEEWDITPPFYRGWWERRVAGLAAFTGWLISYMTAKGVVIVRTDEFQSDYGETRQQRRAAKRAMVKHIPQPWHIITVKPTRIDDREQEGSGRGVSYRFDVRGHLRFGRHKRADGTYSQTVEWVRPHQRGLKHSRYVPSTYHYDKDKSPRI